MSQGVVFKQWYKSRNISSTPTLNRKHLVYMATRPGAVHNPECGFGLWGRLPGTREPESINDLRLAKRIVTQASKDHTLWRAVISVDKETAIRHDLYNRKTWESLVNSKIDVLAKEMGIKPSDFCWVASMHYEKNHPHVHIMYWDSSDAVHQEHIPAKRFEVMAEHVRSEFGREIYREELREKQAEQSGEVKALRLELRALLQEANLAEALDLSHIKKPVVDRLAASLADLAATVPTKGSIDYAYLAKHPAYLAKVDAFTDEVLKISDFQKILKQYMAATQEISAMYGNGDERSAYQLEKAKKDIYKAFGNEIMNTIREFRKDLTQTAPTDRGELQAVVKSTANAILKASPLYQELLQQMPRERTPTGVLMRDEEFRKGLCRLTRQVCSDVRINARLNGYVQAAGADISKDKRTELRAEVFKDANRAVSALILDKLREDAGYPEQAKADVVTNLLIRLFGQASQRAGQGQAQRDLTLRRHRAMSKEAKQDRKAQLEQGGSWPIEQ